MKKIISILTIVGLILGILLGLYLPSFSSSISFIGDYYVKILKIFITPVIFTSIASTIYITSKKKSRLVLKSVLLFTIMFIVTFLITSLLVTIIDPASGYIFEEVEWEKKVTTFNILSLLPTSLSDIFINPKVFIIIVISYLFGKIGSLIKGSEKVFNVIDKIKKVLYKILGYFMYITPLAVISLISNTTLKYGVTLLGSGLKYILTAWGCSIICLILVMILPAFFIGRVKPLDYIKKVYKVWIITLTTRSSAATLPYTCKVCNEEFGVKEEVTDVVVPLGCTIHMCGGAVSFALLGLFCAKLYGVNITFMMYLIMIVSSLLINMAAPGIPGGGIVIGASYLELLGIPLNFIGFYSGIYTFLDMIYTTLNVTGDITANIIINKQMEKEEKHE